MGALIPKYGHLTIYLVMGGGALNILHDRVGFPWGGQGCLGPLYFKSVRMCRLSKYGDDQASVSTSVSWGF